MKSIASILIALLLSAQVDDFWFFDLDRESQTDRDDDANEYPPCSQEQDRLVSFRRHKLTFGDIKSIFGRRHLNFSSRSTRWFEASLSSPLFRRSLLYVLMSMQR